jgi:putative copper resistance protein D
MDAALISVRGVHFAATAMTAGALLFLVAVAAPAFRASAMAENASRFGAWCIRIVWASLAVAVVSGALWVACETASMSDMPFGEAIRAGMLPIVLTQTHFGIVSDIRLLVALLLAAALAFANFSNRALWAALACATVLLGLLAFTGHAVATVGPMAMPHLVSDVVHCFAAGAWIGGLVPLALLLAQARHSRQRMLPAYHATRRFSALGMMAVAALIASGTFNAWVMVGSFRALATTLYGQVLLVKLALFAVMLAVAISNRLYFMPRLVAERSVSARAHKQLLRNSSIEIALGLLIFGIVGVLGTLHPATHAPS